MVRKNAELLSFGSARGCLGVSAQQIHIALDVESSAVGTLSLHQHKVNALCHIAPFVLAVPSTSRVGPFVQFLSPTVEYGGFKLHDALVAALGTIHIVYAVAVG